MAFIDDLTTILNLMVLVSAVVFYTGFFVWWHARKQDYERAAKHLREGGVLMAFLGGLILIIALWGQLTWPFGLSGGLAAYNLYFFDPLLLLSIMLVAFGVAAWFKLPTHYIGMLGVVIGCGVIYYALRADFVYGLALTKEPFETLLLYLAWGGAAILAYPVTLYVDWFVQEPTSPGVGPLPSGPKPDYPMMWTGWSFVFLIVVALAGVAAVAYGFTAAWSHLAGPP
jgi:uncharacterized membrane protein